MPYVNICYMWLSLVCRVSSPKKWLYYILKLLSHWEQSEHFPFLGNSVAVSEMRCRSMFYTSLGRLLMVDLGEDEDRFDSFMLPLTGTVYTLCLRMSGSFKWNNFKSCKNCSNAVECVFWQPLSSRSVQCWHQLRLQCLLLKRQRKHL